MPVTELYDITAKHLGIELSDGRMAVLLPKGTNFPTLSPFSKEFYTAIGGQQRLEVPVYEGSAVMAQENDLCGIVMMRLPEGLPRGTPVNIAFGLDHDRTITVAVKMRTEAGHAKTVRLQRNRNPAELRQIESTREQLTLFLDKWSEKGELFEAEVRTIYAILDQLDEAINEDPLSRRRPLDQLISDTLRIQNVAKDVRGTSAMITAVLVAGEKYIDDDRRKQLIAYEAALQQARERGDWETAAALASQADANIWSLSGPILRIIHCRTLANQYRLSPALDHRIRGALRDIDEGLDGAESERIGRGIDELNALWDDLLREVDLLGEQPPALTGVLDRN